MKTTLLSILVVGTLNAWAGNSERVILKDSKTFLTEVSVETVRCSEIGYGAKELKINLAALDGWTLFDHTNSHLGEFGEPCMTAGMCKRHPEQTGGFTINDLIQNNPGLETITVEREVVENKIESKDEDGNDICIRSLSENLTTMIRGIKFAHSRWGADQNFAIEACRK